MSKPKAPRRVYEVMQTNFDAFPWGVYNGPHGVARFRTKGDAQWYADNAPTCTLTVKPPRKQRRGRNKP